MIPKVRAVALRWSCVHEKPDVCWISHDKKSQVLYFAKDMWIVKATRLLATTFKLIKLICWTNGELRGVISVDLFFEKYWVCTSCFQRFLLFALFLSWPVCATINCAMFAPELMLADAVVARWSGIQRHMKFRPLLSNVVARLVLVTS